MILFLISSIFQAFLKVESIYITSTFPPAASIFSAAVLLNLWALTVSFCLFSISQYFYTIDSLAPLYNSLAINNSGVTTVFSSNLFRSSTFIIAYSCKHIGKILLVVFSLKAFVHLQNRVLHLLQI